MAVCNTQTVSEGGSTQAKQARQAQNHACHLVYLNRGNVEKWDGDCSLDKAFNVVGHEVNNVSG
jgi:hypothetical protein